MTKENNTKPLDSTTKQQKEELKLLDSRLKMYQAEEAELVQSLRKNFSKQGSVESIIRQVKKELK